MCCCCYGVGTVVVDIVAADVVFIGVMVFVVAVA